MILSIGIDRGNEMFEELGISFDPIGTHPITREFHNVNCRFSGAIHNVDRACISVLSQVIRVE